MNPRGRAPVMAPAPAAGLGRAVVRRRRLSVEDGALVLRSEDGRREVLAASGELTSATWVPAVAGRPEALVRETLELGRAAAPPLALPLDDWLGAEDRAVPRQRGGGAVCPLDATGSIGMRISGAAAVADALGLRVNTGAAVSPGAREIGAGARAPLLALVLMRAWIVPALLAAALLVTELGPPIAVVWLVVVMGVALLVSLVTSLVVDVRTDQALDRVDLPEPGWRPLPTVAATRPHMRVSLLSPGRDWLVVRDSHGRECWTPGPGLGGVRTAQVRGSWLAFEDDQGSALQRLWWPLWGDASRLQSCLAELTARGYTVVPDGPAPTGPLWRPPPRAGDDLPRDRDGSPGRPLAAAAAPLIAFFLGDLARQGIVSPLAAAPAVLALVPTLIVMGRGLRQIRDLRPRIAPQLGQEVHDDPRDQTGGR